VLVRILNKNKDGYETKKETKTKTGEKGGEN
jgi:hypothetical protein